MRIIGVDPSLTATGLATPEQVTTLRPPNGMKGPKRLAWIRDMVMSNGTGPFSDNFTEAHGADLVVLEGYSYASAHGAHQLGELGGVLRVALWEAGIPYVEVSPGQLKQYATGKGNATKDDVLAAAIRRLNFQGSDHNQADALWLHHMGVDAYSNDPLALPKTHRAALDKITWPLLAEFRSLHIEVTP